MSVQSKFPYRLAAIDLDDTLLGPDKQVSAANAAAINQLRELGVRVMLASGRRHENMLRFHRLLGLEGPIVSCQGALVKHAETDAILHQHFMSAEQAMEVVNHGVERDATMVYYHADGPYVQERNVFTDIYETRSGSSVVVAGDLRELAGYEPQKILWICPPELVEAQFPQLQEHYRGRVDMLVTDPEYIEFMSPGVSKAVGVAAAAKRYGIDRSEVLTFGDGNNDVSMLEWAGLGVAMAHGKPSAHAAANWLSPEGDPETSFAGAVARIVAEAA